MSAYVTIPVALACGIGIGLIAPSLLALASGKSPHGIAHGAAGHGTQATPLDKPFQVTRSARINLAYPREQAIQLFTAEGEKYWLGDLGWNPTLLRGDGFNRDDVFAVANNTFITITYDPEQGLVEYARVQAGRTAGTISIKITDNPTGSVADVTYNMAALSKDGIQGLNATTEEAFAKQMADWGKAIVTNGSKIEAWLASRTAQSPS